MIDASPPPFRCEFADELPEPAARLRLTPDRPSLALLLVVAGMAGAVLGAGAMALAARDWGIIL